MVQVYSIGSNGDTNFEEAMLNSTACDVHTFDPTLGPQAMAAVQRVVVGSKDKLHFHPVGEPLVSSCVECVDVHAWVFRIQTGLDALAWCRCGRPRGPRLLPF